jgi:hypothetical protein
MAASAIWLLSIAVRIKGSTSATVSAMFYGGLVAALAVALTLAWAGWRRIPPQAAFGALQVGPDGVGYSVGPDTVRIPWNRIAAIHPVRQMAGKPPVAIWLPIEGTTTLTGSQEFALYRMLHGNPYRPVERPDGVLLPLRLFAGRKGNTDVIVEVLRKHHATASGSASDRRGTDAD